MSDVFRVFIYGSLLPGEVNHHELAGARFLKVARTERGVALVRAGRYPSLVFVDDAAGERRAQLEPRYVEGELYEVTRDKLAALDRFEDHPRTFRRRTIRLEGGDEALAYALAPSVIATLPVLSFTSWRARSR